MSKYYYLVASLPYLKIDTDSFYSINAFVSECKKWLGAEDLKNLINTDIDKFDVREEDLQVIKDWKEFDLNLRTEIAKAREERKHSAPVKIPSFLKDVFDQETPLLMEKSLAEIRWDFIQQQEAGFYFDINIIILYYMKLQILNRLNMFNTEKGKPIFEKLCEVSYD